MSKAPRAIVFDLFHTLVDPEEFRPKEYKRAELVADFLSFDTAGFLAYWDSTAKRRLTTPRPAVEYLRDFASESGRAIPDSRLLRADLILRRYQDTAILSPHGDVLWCLAFLKEKGYRLGLLSNSFEGDARLWPRSPLAQYFDATVFSHEVGMAKPDPAIFHYALKLVGATGAESFYVGDGHSGELLGAKKAGFSKVIFSRRFVATNGLRTAAELEELAAQADATVDNYGELCRMITNAA